MDRVVMKERSVPIGIDFATISIRLKEIKFCTPRDGSGRNHATTKARSQHFRSVQHVRL